jgi:hypothetical protein
MATTVPCGGGSPTSEQNSINSTRSPIRKASRLVIAFSVGMMLPLSPRSTTSQASSLVAWRWAQFANPPLDFGQLVFDKYKLSIFGAEGEPPDAYLDGPHRHCDLQPLRKVQFVDQEASD